MTVEIFMSESLQNNVPDARIDWVPLLSHATSLLTELPRPALFRFGIGLRFSGIADAFQSYISIHTSTTLILLQYG